MKDQQEDAPDTIENKERGCGYLKPNSTYLRIDPSLISEDGEIPLFVEFENPIKYKEEHFRGWKSFPGVQFELKWDVETNPQDEVVSHIERLSSDSPSGSHAGQDRSTFAHDILMWVGESYYEEPEEFIQEAKTMGANKRIPKNNPPIIDPMRTRVFLIHPNAIEDDDGNNFAGIIGYFYPSRVVHTKDEDGEVPQSIQEKADQGLLDVVERGQEVPEDAQETSMEDFAGENEDE